MIEILQVISEIKEKTGADYVVLGNEGEGCILVIQKNEFEQHNKMPINTNNTVTSIIKSFNQSYADREQNND